MRGMTLLELLVAISLFSVIVFVSYHAFEEQRVVLKGMESRARPETESNFRMLVIKHFLERSSGKFRIDPFLEKADFFFPDLSFGSQPESGKFSAAVVTGTPIRFIRSGSNVMVATGSPVEKKKTYLLAGRDSAGSFGWRYDECEQISTTASGIVVTLKSLETKAPTLENGTLIEIEIHGFAYQNSTLYWISPGGAMQPYFNDLDRFEYTWNKPTLTVTWQKGELQTEFRCEL
jgi:prepilin-type N-terminal cleavage/methylation domain-containing protein